ncbi:MAG TPA: diaminopropionate ammonia-lyase [Candidatus Dorea intestinavium]|nr:diaminopropionate ammonia-lyase [Candidatus Dorea intestinavium]
MKNDIKLVQLPEREGEKTSLDFLNKETVEKVCNFHKSFPMYKETPLVDLAALSKKLGLKNLFVKDESYRFGLNAFKVLGGSFAIGNYLAKTLGMDISELPFEKMTSPEIKEKLGDITFVTATDGNHGRGVAWTANQLKQGAVVYMPKGSAKQRLEAIRKEGAEASITDFNYDEAVRYAYENGQKNNWIMVQDTAWEGYTDIPTWIIQGYATMAFEAYSQLKEKPTHIFIQAGVGSLAAAVTGFFSSMLTGDDAPIITVVEPDKADCLFRTAKANDGKRHFVTDDMATIMAGLACGEPCSVGWEVLRDYAKNYISCADYISAKGMRILGNPLRGDDKVISGESGAVTLGVVAEIMANPDFAEVKKELKLDENSTVLCFSTEGDTDEENYLNIVWDGKEPSFNK